MGCAKEKILGLLVSLEREISKVDKRAAGVVRLYRERIEELLAGEVEAELWR